MIVDVADIGQMARCVREGVSVDEVLLDGNRVSFDDQAVLKPMEKRCLLSKDYRLLKLVNRALFIFDLNARSNVMRSRPLHIQLEHTTFCNGRCIMCDHAIAGNKGSKHIEPELIETLSGLFPYAEQISLHGNGEPLLHPQIVDLLSLYRNYGMTISLTSNLTRMTSQIAALLAEMCDSIHVSCDGCNKELYESIRVGLRFDDFLSGLRIINDCAPKAEKTLDAVLMRQNVFSLVDIVDFASFHGFAKVVFAPLGVHPLLRNEMDSHEAFRDIALEMCKKAIDRGAELGLSVTTPFDCVLDDGQPFVGESAFDRRDFLGGPDKTAIAEIAKNNPNYSNSISVRHIKAEECSGLSDAESRFFGGVCEYPFGKTYIDLNGNVSVCCVRSRFSLGKISDDKTFLDIWNGREYRSIRETFYSGKLPRLCANCHLMSRNNLKFICAKEF